ncbi:transporter [Xaviernesmea oryzae]|uniref:Transporter n=1 Tax=Xaviernesmea oryzae TaxID=464029 RepID=A0A1Q9ASH1_9HYPH|nr:lipopolysaccharide biosynthesis protein [Xaviernesmea oryzae]OLP58370.1 transporter [Xaviernesmea oryzae]SEL80909.1 Membrane protein involved in the export of O-antigen and teichoic acid [Xaviernesmea oryzae]
MITSARTLYDRHHRVVHAYLSMVGGSVVRLVLSLVYFVCVANVLPISEFGLFASASATGVMVSRALAFGFMSPLYRVATVKHRLIGTYTAGFLAGGLLSLPLVMALCTLIYLLLFAQDMASSVFLRFMLAEIICWRGLEVVSNVLNGTGQFARSALMVVIGQALRTLSAVLFYALAFNTLAAWSSFYLASNVLSLAIAITIFYPKVRLRWRPALYVRRWVDSVSVAGAEILFYVQSEFDKLVVLAAGGPEVTGIYAIVMRLADLTALPVRSFNTLLVQQIMRSPAILKRGRTKPMIEAMIAGVSFLAIASMALYLMLFPRGLGGNVAQIAPYVAMVLLVPAFRNLVEYHSELLYATGQTVRRVVNLAGLGALKIGLLSALLAYTTAPGGWVPLLNLVFFAVYATSMILTYPAVKRWAAAR